MKKFLLIQITFLISLIISGCTPAATGTQADSESSGGSRISFASWNTQTFFDANIDGTEYDDYKSYAKWSKDKYITRLGRLCQVMTVLNPDIFVLEEIENQAVVQDITNQLAGNSWSAKNKWNYVTFVKNKDTAIGCAVFSRFPLKNGKTHVMDIRTQQTSQPKERPVFQIQADINGKELNILVNHWKSKSGGEKETEIWRDWQELICQRELEKLRGGNGSFACIVCGDFNRDASDFTCDFNSQTGANTCFRGAGGVERLYSPWFTRSGAYTGSVGSYYYQGKWERIDTIFAAGNVTLAGFAPKNGGEWANNNGTPNEYKIYNGEGYSDHLPVMCFLEL